MSWVTFGVDLLPNMLAPMLQPNLLIFQPCACRCWCVWGLRSSCDAARRFVDSMDGDQIFVKLDFANAFNCLHGDHMLERVRNIIPEIYCFCFSAYRNHSILHFGDFSLMSRVGPQQGDPLAGLLFCLAIQKLLRATSSAFTSGYMDDRFRR